MNTVRPVRDLEDFKTRAFALLERESDIESYIEDPLAFRVQLRVYLKAYAQEEGGEAQLLLEFLNNLSVESEVKRVNSR